MEDEQFRETLNRDGYSQEEKYFYERNRELIRRAREKKLREEKEREKRKENPKTRSDRGESQEKRV